MFRIRGQRLEDRVLVGREETLGYLLTGEIGADIFHVDADIAITGDRVESQPMRMRHIEAEPAITELGSQRRFSIGVVAKAQCSWLGVQVAAEDGSEQAAPNDKVILGKRLQ